MAKTEITYVNLAPIFKVEKQADGSLLIEGKATDETLDSDEQICDHRWASQAMAKWLETGGNLRVQHNPSLYPAGIGIELNIQEDGSYIKGEVIEPTAKLLVEKGVLRSFSIGISQPKVVKDARAPGGRIVGGDIVEVSLVDRPANPSAKFALAKGVISGEWVGEMEEVDEESVKTLTADAAKEEADAATELDRITQAMEVIKGSRVFYTNDHKETVNKAMADLHESLAKAFPGVCEGMSKAEDEVDLEKADDKSEEEKKDDKDTDEEVADENADEADDDEKDPNADEEDDKKPADKVDTPAEVKEEDEDDAEDEDDDETEDEDEDAEEVEAPAPAEEAAPEAEAALAEADKVATIAVGDPATELVVKMLSLEKSLRKLQKKNDKLQKQYDELASEPDPAQAPVRGTRVLQKAARVETPEAQKSAVDPERAEQVAWLRALATSGEPTKAAFAQSRLNELGEDYF